MVLAWVLPLLEISHVEVDFARVPDPPNGYHIVLMGCETYRIIELHTVNSCSIVFFAALIHVYTVQKVCTSRGELYNGTTAHDMARVGYHPLHIVGSPQALDL